jgi:hypothetical protein
VSLAIAVLNRQTTVVLDLTPPDPPRSPPVPRRSRLAPNATADLSPPDWSASSVFHEITANLRQLPRGRGTLTAPKVMWLGDTARIVARVAHGSYGADILSGLPPGVTQEWSSAVSPTMKARLSGPGFEVESVGSEEQPLGDDGYTEWNWLITPRMIGDHELICQITAVVSVGGFQKTKDVVVQSRRIRVRVRTRRLISSLISDHASEGLAFVLGTIAVAAGRSLRERYRRWKESRRSRIVQP